MKDSLESDTYDKLADESSFLGKILSKIPGFSGYLEQNRRREADQLLRQTLAARLEESRLYLATAHQELSRDIIKAIDHAEPLGRADTRLMGLIGKIKDAPVGYRGFLAAAKMSKEDLEAIYQFDENMLGHVDAIGAEVANLVGVTRDDGDIGGAIRALDNECQKATAVFQSRSELLTGIG